MARFINFPTLLNLQLFADGGAGGDGGTGAEGATGVTATAAVSQTKGVKTESLDDVKYGIQEKADEETPAAEVKQTASAETALAEDRAAKFKALIEGEYKDLFDAKMQDTVQKRVKNAKGDQEKYLALAPTLEKLGKKYGVDPTNIEALNKAIEDDNSYYEEEALEKGITVEQLKEIRKMERENAELKKAVEENNRRENANKIYSQWMEQEEQTKRIYPSFSLKEEMKNPDFVNLLRSNVNVQTAFEVIHKDEIITGAMQYTAKQVKQKVTDSIIANGARPIENGISSQSSSRTKSDVSQLTKADLAEINRRVARGERISFG